MLVKVRDIGELVCTVMDRYGRAICSFVKCDGAAPMWASISTSALVEFYNYHVGWRTALH